MTIDNVMRHGAYEAAITFDAAAALLNGEVINLRDVAKIIQKTNAVVYETVPQTQL
jgi:predicted HicB family RNase H-like nuclease